MTLYTSVHMYVYVYMAVYAIVYLFFGITVLTKVAADPIRLK